MTSIDMGAYTLHIDLARPYAGSSANEVSKWGWREILLIFNREANRLKGPTQVITPEAIGLGQTLARRYTKEQMVDMVHVYWSLYSEDVYEGNYGHPLRAMLAKADILAREVKNHVRV